MVGQSSFVFFNKVTSPGVPENPYRNNKADVIALEISGSFTAGKFCFEGRTNMNSENWTPIVGINLSDYSITTAPTAAGIYEVGVEGLQMFRVRIDSLSGGDATVFARVVNTAGG